MWQWFNRNFTKTRILFVHKENNNMIYSTILLPELPSTGILESTPEHDQRNQRCLRSADSTRMLNVNNADYVDYVLLLFPLRTKSILVAL